MFAKCQILLGKLDCIMPLKKKITITGQLSFSYRRLSLVITDCRRLLQVVADYHRYQNITSGKMITPTLQCIIFAVFRDITPSTQTTLMEQRPLLLMASIIDSKKWFLDRKNIKKTY